MAAGCLLMIGAFAVMSAVAEAGANTGWGFLVPLILFLLFAGAMWAAGAIN